MLNSTFQNRPRTAELLEGLSGVLHTASIGGSLHKARIVVERNARGGGQLNARGAGSLVLYEIPIVQVRYGISLCGSRV